MPEPNASRPSHHRGSNRMIMHDQHGTLAAKWRIPSNEMAISSGTCSALHILSSCQQSPQNPKRNVPGHPAHEDRRCPPGVLRPRRKPRLHGSRLIGLSPLEDDEPQSKLQSWLYRCSRSEYLTYPHLDPSTRSVSGRCNEDKQCHGICNTQMPKHESST